MLHLDLMSKEEDCPREPTGKARPRAEASLQRASRCRDHHHDLKNEAELLCLGRLVLANAYDVVKLDIGRKIALQLEEANEKLTMLRLMSTWWRKLVSLT